MSMQDINIHGFTVRYDYADHSNPTLKAALEYLQDESKFDKKQAEDVFNNARRDSDRKTEVDFYDRHYNKERTITIRYDGSYYRIQY